MLVHSSKNINGYSWLIKPSWFIHLSESYISQLHGNARKKLENEGTSFGEQWKKKKSKIKIK